MQTPMNWIVTDSGAITVFANGKSYSFGKDHQFYIEAKEALHQGNLDEIVKLHDMSRTVENFTEGNVEVRDGVVYYKQKPLREKFSQRIIALMTQKLPWRPMLLFLENLMKNPSMRAVDELYDFLAHRALPITDDGHFLAYKRVRDDWTDLYSGTLDNSVGKTVSMERNEVDDERNIGCSYGLHAGSIEYVKSYMSGGHVIVVKINPKDVVSVPSEADCTKLRCCEYVVVDVYKEDLVAPVYSGDGSSFQLEESYNAKDEYEEDEDWEDDENNEEENSGW